jgi:hypothetical protein
VITPDSDSAEKVLADLRGPLREFLGG